MPVAIPYNHDSVLITVVIVHQSPKFDSASIGQ